jgi:hypothetical protein
VPSHFAKKKASALTSFEVVSPQEVVIVQGAVLSNHQVSIGVVQVVRSSNGVEVTFVEVMSVSLGVASQQHLTHHSTTSQ